MSFVLRSAPWINWNTACFGTRDSDGLCGDRSRTSQHRDFWIHSLVFIVVEIYWRRPEKSDIRHYERERVSGSNQRLERTAQAVP